MWVQKRNGSTRVFERLMDYSTGKPKTYSISIQKNTAENRKKALNILRLRAESTRPVDSSNITLGQLIEKYRQDQKLSVSTGTYQRNYFTCNRFMDILGKDTPVESITAQYVRQRFLETGKKATTLNEYILRFKSLMNWAYRNEYIQSVQWLTKLQYFDDNTRRNKLHDKFLEKDELSLLLDAIPDMRWNLVIRFMVMSGMRFGEVSALRIENIDMDSRYITIEENYNSVVHEVSVPKTVTSNRDIFMQDELFSLVKEILEFSDMIKTSNNISSDLLFCMDDGSHIELAAFNKYLKEHNPLSKKVTSHIFRHTHTSILAEEGVDVEVIAERLGHSDSQITKDVYLHVTQKIKKKKEDAIRNIHICNQTATS